MGDRWVEVVAQLQAAGALVALVRELAVQAQLVSVEPAGDHQRWTLMVERETLRSAPLVDKLQAALVAHVDPQARLQVQAGVALDSPARRDAEQAAMRQQQAEIIIQQDPLVVAMLSQFRTALNPAAAQAGAAHASTLHSRGEAAWPRPQHERNFP